MGGWPMHELGFSGFMAFLCCGLKVGVCMGMDVLMCFREEAEWFSEFMENYAFFGRCQIKKF
jgi:hypothetical protein